MSFSLGKPLELLEKVKIAKSLFQQVVEVSQILNSIFSFPVLVLLIVVVALETLDLFVFICHADFEPILADEMNIANVMSFSFDIAVTYFTLAAADLPVAEVCFLFPFSIEPTYFSKIYIYIWKQFHLLKLISIFQ